MAVCRYKHLPGNASKHDKEVTIDENTPTWPLHIADPPSHCLVTCGSKHDTNSLVLEGERYSHDLYEECENIEN